jgi:asparaginyl-tRNA synthetase
MKSDIRIDSVVKTSEVGTELTLCGWVKTRRDSKDVSFVELTDGSSIKGLQIVFQNPKESFGTEFDKVQTGASLQVEGKLIESLGSGQRVELIVSKLKVFGSADPEVYPLQKKRHSNEFLRTIAHLRPRTNTFGATFRVRSQAAFAVHEFFHSKNFVHVHTPIITTSDCEGAGEMFHVSTLNHENPPRNDKGKIDYEKDFFGKEASLTVSGQLEGETFATALTNIYTFGPTFRAENSNTPRHLAEFWMIEPEMAFCDLQGNAALAEEFVKSVLGAVLNRCADDLEFFDQWVEKGLIEALRKVQEASFARITYTEAIQILQSAKTSFEYPVSWGIDLQTEHERYLSEVHVQGPVFVTNYPKEIKAFYMRVDEGEKTVSAMDLLVPRLGELIGGSQREERADVLERRILECNLPLEPYWWYLDLRKFGTVPHAGFGLGFERLIMYLTGMQNIRDVIPFPRVPGNADF